jgi:oligo-1,6-glucosidase
MGYDMYVLPSSLCNMSLTQRRSDYEDIDPRYGTLVDWDALLAGAHERGMKLMCALYPFDPLLYSSILAQHGPRRESHLGRACVVPRVPLEQEQPQARLVHLAPTTVRRRREPDAAEQLAIILSGYVSIFCVAICAEDGGVGSAWAWDEGSQEYYLHMYLDKQPDLNWENPTLRCAIFDMMKRWLARGCDGFRVRSALAFSPGCSRRHRWT